MRRDCHAEGTISWRVEKSVNVLVLPYHFRKALFTQKIFTIKAQKRDNNVFFFTFAN